MTDITLRHGPEFQRSVIRMMMLDRAFCSKCCEYLKEDFFSGELSWFFRKSKERFEKDKETPSAMYLGAEVNKQSDGDRPKFEEQLTLISGSDQSDKGYLKRELTRFWKKNILVSGWRQGADIFNAKDEEGGIDWLTRVMKQVNEADFENDLIVHFGDSEQMIEKALAQTRDAVPTGIRAIDEAMNGGLMPQTWTTFLGGSNVGKSMICASLAKSAALKKKRTFVMIHEDEMLPTKLRYLACFSDVPLHRIRTPKAFRSEEDNRRITEADAMLREFVTLRFMYGKEAVVESACQAARRMMDEWEYHFLLDDYPQCMKTTTFKSIENTYALHEFTTQELKQLCCELNIPGAGGAQTNRLGHKINRSGADLLRVTDVGDSWGIIKKSSNVITMNRSQSDVEANRIVFLLDKVRDGRCPVAVQCVSAYDKSQVFLPWSETNKNQTEVPVTKE